MNQYDQTGVAVGMNDGVGAGLKKPYSGVGITSFAIACLGALVMMSLVVIAGVMENSSPEGMDEESTEAMLLGFGMIGDAGLLIISGILGIVSLCQTNRKWLFGLLGLCISAMVLFMFFVLLIVGLSMG